MRTAEQERARFNWITTGEAGKRLGVKPAKVRELIGRKKLTALNVNEGGSQPSYMVDPVSVDAYLARNTTEADAA